MCRRAASAVALALAICVAAPASAPASASPPLAGVCTVATGPVPGALGHTACNTAMRADSLSGIVKKVAGVGKKIVTGPTGLLVGGAAGVVAGVGLSAIVSWVLGGAGSALHETAAILGKTTTPQLGDAWFSTAYAHMWEIATLLTLPFLCAAAVQALLHSDLAMLARVAFGYLPLAMLAIGIALPVTSGLLAGSDRISNVIEGFAGGAGTSFLAKTATKMGGLSVLAGSPFVAFLIGFFVAAGALVLWLELLLREVAVYVIVLSLPLMFAAFVWPARRVLAIRAMEMLVALILSKIAIVSVLALGAGALEHGTDSSSIGSLLSGVALVTLGVFAPWALVKLMPLGEIAASAAGPMRGHLTSAKNLGGSMATPWADAGSEWAKDVVTRMRNHASSPDSAPTQGADAEAGRMANLERERASDGAQGVDGGSTTDPMRGTAGPLGGQIAGAPAVSGTPDAPAASESAPPAGPAPSATPGASGTPPDPAESGSELHQTSRAERGPSGFPGAEALWQADDDTWAPDVLWSTVGPPEQEPEDGHL
jgi:hypothetical protein